MHHVAYWSEDFDETMARVVAAGYRTAQFGQSAGTSFAYVDGGPAAEFVGEHVAPFVCHIGDKWLKIDASVRVTGPKGEVFETETPQAMKRASKIRQTNVAWAWSADDPRKAR